METARNFLVTRGVDFLVQVFAAIVFFVVGRWMIRGARSFVRRWVELRQLDPTLAKYLDQTIGALLTLLLVIAALGVAGVQTNTLAGLLAATGVAVGVAWSGLLSNIAAGLFMVSLRPFKKGDTVQIGGVIGDVELVGFYGTSLLAPDGTKVIVGNAKALGENIHNLSAVPHRRIEARAQLPWGSDPSAFYEAVRKRLGQEKRVLAVPAPIVETLDNNAAGPLAVIRPYCAPADYGDVLFLTNRIVAEEIARAGFAAPNPAHLPR